MAIIKFDSEKADALIRDLKKISSDIESNMGKVYTNSYGKEINLNDSRLKVYAYRNKTIDVTQDDGTVVQEIVKEKYLKHNYVANARAYNQHVRNIYKKSNSAKTKATQSIESVINSLNKIKSLISEFETESTLRLSSSLDDVGQFNFNFLSAYGPMGKPQGYSSSMGAVVVDEAFTSLHLGVLGERPTSINLEKLPVFDGMLEIARNNGLTYEEKFEGVKSLLMENVLEVNPEEMDEKTKNALECMIGIAESNDIKIDDSLRIESLVNIGIPIIENLESSELAVEFKPGDIINPGLIAGGAALTVTPGQVIDMLENIDINKNGKPDKDEADDIIANLPDIKKPLENYPGTGSYNDLDKNDGKGNGNGNGKGYNNFAPSNPGHGNGKPAGAPADQDLPKLQDGFKNSIGNIKNGIKDNGRGNDVPKDNGLSEPPKVQKVDINNAREAGKQLYSSPIKDDIIDRAEVHKQEIKDDIKLSSEDLAIDQELQSNKISLNYDNTNVTESSNSSSVDVELDADTGQKGAGIVAGAAGLGALTNGGSNIGGAMPQVNGMAAGEILGTNNSSNPANMGMMLGDTTNSSASTGNVVTNGTTGVSIGGESTSDRGSLNANNSSQKPTNTSAAGRGGSTLEDKNNNKDDNSYGKPNKPDESQENDKKGMLGDASIAELEAKDEKEIKIATGITAGTVITSGILALVNVLPWIMLILAILAIGTYVGYRIKKKKDKEKRRAALDSGQVQDTTGLQSNANVDIATTNVESVAVTAVSSETEVATPVPAAPIVDGEFSSQPYEPSRDGVTEIAISSSSENKE